MPLSDIVVGGVLEVNMALPNTIADDVWHVIAQNEYMDSNTSR